MSLHTLRPRVDLMKVEPIQHLEEPKVYEQGGGSGGVKQGRCLRQSLIRSTECVAYDVGTMVYRVMGIALSSHDELSVLGYLDSRSFLETTHCCLKTVACISNMTASRIASLVMRTSPISGESGLKFCRCDVLDSSEKGLHPPPCVDARGFLNRAKSHTSKPYRKSSLYPVPFSQYSPKVTRGLRQDKYLSVRDSDHNSCCNTQP